jgi:hydrophobic/amphiphilic exporter-1 (mainly G- bacteria), HAE1 family
MKTNGLLALTVKRPILTSVIFLVIILLGFVSLTRLSVDLMPDISYPTVTIIANYPNTSPEDMENIITMPIEDAVSGIQGIELITSNSVEGRSIIRLSFAWGTDITEAVNDIRDRVDRILGRLPDDMDKPMIRKFDVSAFPIMMLGVSSQIDRTDLNLFVENNIKYRLERIPGVANIDISGGLNKEIHALLKVETLEAFHIMPEMISAALRSENRNIPIGTIKEHGKDILLRSPGEFSSVEDIENIPITSRNGTTILLKDIAEVFETTEDETQSVRVNGERGIVISLNKRSDANTVAVAADVNEEIERINQDYPFLQMVKIRDTSLYISSSIKNIGFSLIIGALLAILILFLFLENIPSTLIISTAVPISITATFLLMYLNGYTLNLMTFGGLALGIGMLLDNSIVVLENIFRHNEEGMVRKKASVVGVSEVVQPLIASTLTTIVVFLPVVFIRGIAGIMFRQFAVIVSFSLLCSLFVALFLVPMLASRMMHLPVMTNGCSFCFRIARKVGKIVQNLELKYEAFLLRALHKPSKIIYIAAISVAFSFFLLSQVGTDFMPAADEGEVRISATIDEGLPLEEFEEKISQIEDIVFKHVPEVEFVFARVGGTGWIGSTRGSNTANMRILLKDRSHRRRSSEDISNDLRKRLATIPGIELRVGPGRGLFILRIGSSGEERIAIEVRGRNLNDGFSTATQIQNMLEEIEGITETSLSRNEGTNEQVLRVDRQKAYEMGISVSQAASFLEQVIQGNRATTLRLQGEEFPVIIKLAEEDVENLEDILQLTLPSSSGKMIPLTNFAFIEQQKGPSEIERKDRERIITVNADYSGRDAGSIIADIRTNLAQIPIPDELTVLITGDYEEQQKAFRELIMAIILAILLVYLVMAGQFESVKHPFIVLFSIPGAVIGITIMLILTGTLITMQAIIGMIMLTGIVVNNAIILIDYANQQKREKNLPAIEAIVAAGKRRLRPILMTALTTSLALIPLSIGLGEGGETQAPMARVVIGGLISSTFLTLLLIPAIYTILEKK